MGGKTILSSPTAMLRWMRSRREDEDEEQRQREGKDDQNTDRLGAVRTEGGGGILKLLNFADEHY